MLTLSTFAFTSGVLVSRLRSPQRQKQLALVRRLQIHQQPGATVGDASNGPARLSSEWKTTPPSAAEALDLVDASALAAAPDETHEGAGEQARQRQLILSSVALGTTCAGHLFFPPLGILTTPLIVYLELPIYQAAWRDLVEERRVKINGLMALFTTAAWITRAYVGSAMSIFMLAASDTVTARTRERSQRKLVEMFDQQPRTVWLLVDGQEVETLFARVQVGDLVIVHAGQIMPVDGVVHSGMATVDQHRLTGEARLVEKEVGDPVLAATLLVRGRLVVRVEKAGQTTLAAQIAQILERTTAHHLAVEERGLALAEESVMPSLLISAITLPLRGFYSAVAVLSAMPGIDMHFAGPLALLNCLHLAAQQGILVKDGRSLELLHTVDTVVFDKTGTLTLEQPTVAEVHVLDQYSADQLLAYAAAAEQHQSHPIAQAILDAAQARKLPLPAIHDAHYELGYGLRVWLAQDKETGRQEDRKTADEALTLSPPHPITPSLLIRVGSQRFLQQEGLDMPPALVPIQQRCADIGHALIYVAVDETVAGVLELQPTLRPEAHAVVTALQKQGLTLYILSGDQVEPTRHLAGQLGIDHYFANVLPTDKARFISELQAAGRKVCFVGDGINDAIALKQATVSVSLRGATTIATDTAQIVLMEQSLRQLPRLFDLSHRLERNLMTSFGLSIGTGVVIISGALLFQMGIGAAITFGALAGLGILGNAMTPLLFTLRQEEIAATTALQPNGASHVDR